MRLHDVEERFRYVRRVVVRILSLPLLFSFSITIPCTTGKSSHCLLLCAPLPLSSTSMTYLSAKRRYRDENTEKEDHNPGAAHEEKSKRSPSSRVRCGVEVAQCGDCVRHLRSGAPAVARRYDE